MGVFNPGDVIADGVTKSTDAFIELSFNSGFTFPIPVCEPFVAINMASNEANSHLINN